MEYLTLNNNVQMPLAGFGTFMLSGETCSNAVTNAIQVGYRMIDTAEAYGNEKEVGAGIAVSGNLPIIMPPGTILKSCMRMT